MGSRDQIHIIQISHRGIVSLKSMKMNGNPLQVSIILL